MSSMELIQGSICNDYRHVSRGSETRLCKTLWNGFLNTQNHLNCPIDAQSNTSLLTSLFLFIVLLDGPPLKAERS